MGGSRRNGPRRIGEWLLGALGVFVVLEPIWMLLPFAGFLYGSVLRIETLSRNPETAWLTHFVFPVLAIGWGGPAVAVLGLLVFVAGAWQIYRAKLRKSGLVTGGLYRYVRHPQYVALTLFGLGILLTWGRAIAWIGFFLMLWLYSWLARNEERRCDRLFGAAWARYRERTSFVLPGDRLLRGPAARWRLGRWPAPIRVFASLLVAAGLCFGSMEAVNAWKRAHREVPFLVVAIDYAGEVAADAADLRAGGGDVPFVLRERLFVVRGPWRTAAAPGFAERVARRLPGSGALGGFLDVAEGERIVAFGVPFDAPVGKGLPPGPRGPAEGRGRGPPPDAAGPDRARLLLFRTVGAEPLAPDAVPEFRGARIVPIDLGVADGEEIVIGDVFTPGPLFPAADRFRNLVGQVRAQWEDAATPGVAAVPAAGTRMILVKAPILRTRIDPAFAEKIRVRILASERLRDRLERSGAGGEVVPIAFPRPGPDWYREHHHEARVSLFVMLARRRNGGEDPSRLFFREERELIGAFTAELDLSRVPPADPVGHVEWIGPSRDLEERFAFFLSGL